MNILVLETTCDETAAAVVTDELEVLGSVVASQDELHRRFGGVVPEIASRAHLERILPVIDETLQRAGVTFDGLDAALFICHLKAGLFAFDSAGSALDHTLDVSITEMLLEASRRRDERIYKNPTPYDVPPEDSEPVAEAEPESVPEPPPEQPPREEGREDHEFKEWWKDF